MKSLVPTRLVLNGPMAVTIGSAPGLVDDQPSVGIRKAVGLRPYRPLFAAGLRILPVDLSARSQVYARSTFGLPPISVPIPRQLPLKPIKAPSPPEEPPAEKSRL
jgi:hypothetical protein